MEWMVEGGSVDKGTADTRLSIGIGGGTGGERVSNLCDNGVFDLTFGANCTRGSDNGLSITNLSEEYEEGALVSISGDNISDIDLSATEAINEGDGCPDSDVERRALSTEIADTNSRELCVKREIISLSYKQGTIFPALIVSFLSW